MKNTTPFTKNRFLGRQMETLEERLCLTVAVDVIRGDLVVSGDADGEVAIHAMGDGVYEVTDNGELVSTAEGVKRDIRIRLDLKDPTEDNTVSVNLNEENIRGLFAKLGGGDDTFALTGGMARRIGVLTAGGDDTITIDSHAHDFRAVMGGGSDSLTVGENAMIKRRFFTALGSGDNDLTVDGAIRRGAVIQGGHQTDTVVVSETGTLAHSMIRLGGGENNVEVHGTTRDMRIFSGAPRPKPGEEPGTSAAHVLIGETGRLNGKLLVMTQGHHGSDTLTIAGTVNGHVGFGDHVPPPGPGGPGGDANLGSNEIVITETASIKGNVFARFHGSLSSVDHFGTIGRDLRVHTDIRDNTSVTIDEDAVIGGRFIFHAKDDQGDGGGNGGGPGGR